MSAALGIFRLQLIDSRTDGIRARLNEIRQILESDEELHEANTKAEETGSAHQDALLTLKGAEAEVTRQKVKIEQSESNLYSGSVKNPKELQDLQNELAALKRHLGTLEDRQLEAMLEEEDAAQLHQEAQDELAKVQARLAKEHKALTEEQSVLTKEMERMESEREAALTPLETKLVTIYDDLRQQRRGLAVAEVSEGACAACGATLTPSQNQNARSTTQIYHCPTCGRILFAN